MKAYIIPKADRIRLNISEEILDYEMIGYSKGSKKKEAWAKGHTSFETEDWDDKEDNYNNTQTSTKRSVWDN